MKIEKKHINNILLTILYFSKNDKGQEYEAGGLLKESLGLGVKRKLQKIRKELLTHSQELETDLKAVEGAKEELRQGEINVLLSETVELTSEPALLSEIEKVETKNNYNFEYIEMITI